MCEERHTRTKPHKIAHTSSKQTHNRSTAAFWNSYKYPTQNIIFTDNVSQPNSWKHEVITAVNYRVPT